MSNVQINIGGHVVDVPKMMDLPVRKIMRVISEPDSNKQFSLALDLLCENLDELDVHRVDNLTVHEAVKLVADWMNKSNPDREEPEIV